MQQKCGERKFIGCTKYWAYVVYSVHTTVQHASPSEHFGFNSGAKFLTGLRTPDFLLLASALCCGIDTLTHTHTQAQLTILHGK